MGPSHKYKDLSSVPKTHIKVGIGLVGTGLAGQIDYPISEPQVLMRDPVSQEK